MKIVVPAQFSGCQKSAYGCHVSDRASIFLIRKIEQALEFLIIFDVGSKIDSEIPELLGFPWFFENQDVPAARQVLTSSILGKIDIKFTSEIVELHEVFMNFSWSADPKMAQLRRFWSSHLWSAWPLPPPFRGPGKIGLLRRPKIWFIAPFLLFTT